MLTISEARADQCKYIAGEPSADAIVCGKPVVAGKAWCDECYRRVYYRGVLPPIRIPAEAKPRPRRARMGAGLVAAVTVNGCRRLPAGRDGG
jgi:hypothetical protein